MEKKAVVIGSGFGGLSVAIRLQAMGFKTTICEKRDRPGGRAYVYKENGYTFDAGPTVVTAPECVEELFELSGKKQEDYVKFLPVHPFYRIFFEDGKVFDYSNDTKAVHEQIRRFNPSDVEGYENFLDYSKRVFKKGYTDLAHVPFMNWGSMIKVAPDLMKLGAYRSVYSMVSRFIKDPHLRQVFSFNSLLIGGNPFSASSIYTLIHYLERQGGVFFTKGGTHALVQGLLKLFEDIGGQVRLNAEVEEICTQRSKVNGVRFRSGEKIECDLVVSNAEVMHTYGDLLKNEAAVESSRRRLMRSRYSPSLFLIYLGTKRQWDNLAHHNVIFGPRYKGHLRDIFKGKEVPQDFSLYVHCPSRTDSSVAPEGSEAMYILSVVPHLGKTKVDWKDFGPKYADRIIDYMEDRYTPGIKESIESKRIFTPEDFAVQLNSHLGSAFSLEPVLTQSAYFRLHNRDKNVRGMYFVGAGTHPGAGLPGVINSGKATAGVIAEDYRAAVRPPARVQPSSSLGEAHV